MEFATLITSSDYSNDTPRESTGNDRRFRGVVLSMLIKELYIVTRML